ncbi:phospholipase D family protein [Winogradskyella helgolandensis]|uniref:phospholipase D family protein n=1 Tax=Winogradskyella helgolandensis TaxID=2697010 RepID=UPI0015B87999|nr:phospholipase D family protein [Winogradskyella helgolandensis]
MSTFLTGDDLECKLTDIIWNAKKYIVLISPFIKLDDHIKDVLEKVKDTHQIAVYIVFGKNEEFKYRSFNENDLTFFKGFKNITILYNKDLHAKHYCNESEGLITSLNLYGYSMLNNIEYGVYFQKTMLNPIDKLFEETFGFTKDLIYNQSDIVFLKKPQYSKKLFGLQKVYQQSKILFDVSEEVFSGNNYTSHRLEDFDLETETSLEKKYSDKPERERAEFKGNTEFVDFDIKKEDFKSEENNQTIGYCIRSGEEIPFDPERPYSYNAFRSWAYYKNYEYPENYCHKTGKPSNGKTCMANPILK